MKDIIARRTGNEEVIVGRLIIAKVTFHSGLAGVWQVDYVTSADQVISD